MKKIGKLKTYKSSEIKDSYISIGFECLDRELFKAEKCYEPLGKTGVKYARCQTGWCRCEKEKNGKIRVRSMGFFDFINVEVRAYVKDGALCFADTESVYALPLESLRGVQTVKKTALFHGWNKELLPNDKSFKPYHVGVNQYETIFCKPYYILEAEIKGEIWGVYFPGDELPTLEALTGLHAQQKGD